MLFARLSVARPGAAARAAGAAPVAASRSLASLVRPGRARERDAPRGDDGARGEKPAKPRAHTRGRDDRDPRKRADDRNPLDAFERIAREHTTNLPPGQSQKGARSRPLERITPAERGAASAPPSGGQPQMRQQAQPQQPAGPSRGGDPFEALAALARANTADDPPPARVSPRGDVDAAAPGGATTGRGSGEPAGGASPAASAAASKSERRALEFAESYNRHMAGLTSVAALVGFYARNAPRFDVVNNCVALARLASLAAAVRLAPPGAGGSPSSSSPGGREASALLSEPVDLLLGSLQRDLLDSAPGGGGDDALRLRRLTAPDGGVPVPLARLDARVVASTLHSLAKLGPHTARAAAVLGRAAPATGGPSAAATLARRRPVLAALAAASFRACEARLAALPPRSLAMAAYAGARLGLADVAFMRRVSDLVATASGSAWPPYVPREAPHALRRGLTCPFEPAEAAMLATAYASVAVRAGAGGGAYRQQRQQQQQQPGGSGLDLTGGPMAVPLQRLATSLLPLLPYVPHSLLATMAWASAAARVGLPTFQLALAAEVALRAQRAAEALGGGAEEAEGGRAAEALRRKLTAVVGSAGGSGRPSAAAEAAEADEFQRRMSKILAPALGGGGGGDPALAAGGDAEHDGDTADDGDNDDAMPPVVGDISPRSLATVLRAYATVGARSPQLFTAGSEYFTALFRAGGGAVDGELLSSVAWSLAKAGHADDATPALWGAIRDAAATAAQAQLVGPLPAGGGGAGDAPTAAPGSNALAVSRLRPHYAATVLWALTSASVPAPALTAALLASFASGRVAGFTLPALAQVLWAAAVQPGGLAGPHAATGLRAAWEHVLDLMRVRAVRGSGSRRVGVGDVVEAAASHDDDDGGGFDAGGGGSSEQLLGGGPERARDLDALAARLGAPAPPGSGAAKVQTQLYTSWLALSLETRGAAAAAAPSVDVQAALAVLPAPLLDVWRRAAAAQAGHVSPFHASVVGVLRKVGLRVASEAVTPEGLAVDVLLTEPPSAAPPGAASSGAGPRRIVVEVQGPSHYQGGSALAGTPSAAAAAAAAAARSRRPGWSPDDDDGYAPPEERAYASLRGGSGGGADRLVPTLKTAAKARWLAAAGYDVVTVSWVDWERHPSTQERAELLAEKGVPVPREHLSW